MALDVTGLTRRFGSRLAVDDLGLRVEVGDIYGFLGPNGAGKTTAMRCVLGLIRRDSGQVSIFGDARPVSQRRHVGAMVETPRFHDWLSAKENLKIAAAYAGGDARGRVDEVLDITGLSQRGADKVRALSHGMRQRLGLARALLARPRLLLLDEPTSGMDPRGMADVRRILKDCARDLQMTVVLSSHLLSEVEAICNRVAILDRGRKVAEGEVGTLLGELGGDIILTVGVDRPAAAEDLARRIPGVTVLEARGEEPLRLLLSEATPGQVNRALVEGGVEVCALTTESRTLEDLFLARTTGGALQ